MCSVISSLTCLAILIQLKLSTNRHGTRAIVVAYQQMVKTDVN